MKKYVVGFLFSPNLAEVVLVLKNRPDWQAGLLNGIGGKIEDGESPHNAMSREFVEETGVYISPSDWVYMGAFGGIDYQVFVFMCTSVNYKNCRTIETEEIKICKVANISQLNCVPSIEQLLLICINLDFNALLKVPLDEYETPYSNKPNMLTEFDLTDLKKVCQKYIDFIYSDEYYEDNDYSHYIFESAMITLFGKDIFKILNKK
jgi:8-oxo-dGTP diphosphatase